MKVVKELYLRDFGAVFFVGFIHFFSYPLHLHNDATYNLSMLCLGGLYFFSQIYFHAAQKKYHYQWYWHKNWKSWFDTSMLALLAFSYWLCPLVFALDMVMTESEGALSSVFLFLGLIPYRHAIDLHLIEKQMPNEQIENEIASDAA